MRRSISAIVILIASLALGSVLAQQPPASSQQPAKPSQQPATSPQQPGGSPQQPGTPSQPPGASPEAPAGPAAPASGAPAKPLVPVAASTLSRHPDAYYGESVSMTGMVEQLLSKYAFSVDQGKTRSGGREVLIIAPTLQMPVDANTYVTVLGEVVRFDPAEIGKKAKDYKNDLPAEAAAKYQGAPVIIATSVINTAGLDIAKRLPPPLTAEEQDFQKLMRQIGPANAALRGAIDKADPGGTKEQAAILTRAFAQTETFWKGRSKTDAVKWAADARTMAEAIDKSVAAGKWDEVKTTIGTLGQQCQSCHGTYRERFDDGSFRINKAGSK